MLDQGAQRRFPFALLLFITKLIQRVLDLAAAIVALVFGKTGAQGIASGVFLSICDLLNAFSGLVRHDQGIEHSNS